eukprot:TRINITY_DN413_c0_g2_i1.p1 TRINITY_DN413_c0_g2~~TRINITY_DN413_c0_g2_i1.p1  ORF type:complete len:264 (-),score=112.07 TRINITY_DN413_c0_g2_i1:144-911(-)
MLARGVASFSQVSGRFALNVSPSMRAASLKISTSFGLDPETTKAQGLISSFSRNNKSSSSSFSLTQLRQLDHTMGRYSKIITGKTAKARGSYLRVHFKNTVNAANALQGLTLGEAKRYLFDVIIKKRCIPFRKFNGGVGRTGQAAVYGVSQGRWPKKSAVVLLDLLKNAQSNAEAKDPNGRVPKYVIKHIQVNQAPKQRRRTHRAHGRINAYMSSPCHIEMILKAPSRKPVPKPKNKQAKEAKDAKSAEAKKIEA